MLDRRGFKFVFKDTNTSSDPHQTDSARGSFFVLHMETKRLMSEELRVLVLKNIFCYVFYSVKWSLTAVE